MSTRTAKRNPRMHAKALHPVFESEPESQSGSEYETCSEESSDEEVPDEEVPDDGDEMDIADNTLPFDISTLSFDPSIPQASEDVKEVEDFIQDFNDENGLDNIVNSYERDPDDLDSIDEELYGAGNRAPPEFYQRKLSNTNVEDFKRKHYAKGTIKLIKNAENYWRAFCLEIPRPCRRDCEQFLREINFNIIYTFLYWYLNQRKGPSGRNKRPVKAMGTLIAFWCCLRLYYERVTTEKIDDRLPRGVINNALIGLGKTFKLDHEPRENRHMSLTDLKRQIQTTLCTTMKDFKLGEMRILAVLFLLLLVPQGSRPQSILDVKFRDISILLIRDPEDPTGPPRLTIRLKLCHTKTYKGFKPLKTFLVPEIIYDESLLLSPHVFLLAVLFRNHAFDDPSLNNNPWLINTYRISPTSDQLHLNLKDEISDHYLFRKCVQGIEGYKMASRLPITQDMMGKWIRNIGKELG